MNNQDKALSFLEMASSGNVSEAYSMVHIFRFENGKIVELWDLGQPIPAESINKNGMF